MADEQVTIIRIDTGEAVRSVGDLRQNIKLLKEQLNDYEIGSKEYQETLEALKVSQNALKDAMYATGTSMEQLAADAKGVNVAFDENNKLVNTEAQSYNALVHTLAELKAQWRAATDETERAQIGERIEQVNSRLKTMDASVGNYSRNVGNYTNSVFDAFTRMGGGVGKVINPVKNLTTGMKALSSTPVVTVMALLANILLKVMEGIKGSEENADKMNQALGGLRAVGDVVTKIMQALGAAVTFVAGAFSKVIAAITGTTDAMKERQRIAQEEDRLQRQQRETIIKNAEAERDIAELRAQASDRLAGSAEERLAMLQKAGDMEKAIAQRAYEDAKLAYEIQKAKNALTQSSAEQKQKEAEAYAAMVKAETDYYQQVRSINSGITRERRQMAREAREAAKEALEAKKAEVEAEKALLEQQAAEEAKDSQARLDLQIAARKKQYELDQQNARSRIKNARTLATTLTTLEKKYLADVEKLRTDHRRTVEAQDLLHLKNLADQYAQGTTAYLRAMVDYNKQALAQIDAAGRLEGETVAEYNARRLTAQKAYYASVRALNAKNVEDSTAELRLAVAKEAQGTEAWYAGQLQLAQAQYDKMLRLEGESDTEYQIRKAAAYRALLDAQQAYLDKADEQDRLAVENEMNALQEGSTAYLAKAVELKKYELDTLHQLEGESNAEFRARQLAAEKEYTDAQKALAQERLNVFQQSASGIAGLMDAIADIYEANGEASEKSVKEMKALRIAAATIDMIQGAVAAFVSTWTSTLPMTVKAVLAPVNAATVVAAGTANIAKIRATNVSKSSAPGATPSATPAAVSAPSYAVDVPQVRTLTGAAEEERLNQPQRVYILQSDIEASQGAAKVRVQESTF